MFAQSSGSEFDVCPREVLQYDTQMGTVNGS